MAGAQVSEADIAKMPAGVQQQIRQQLGGQGRAAAFGSGSASVESPATPGPTPLSQARSHFGSDPGNAPDEDQDNDNPDLGSDQTQEGRITSPPLGTSTKTGAQLRSEAQAAGAARAASSTPFGQGSLPGFGSPSADLRAASTQRSAQYVAQRQAERATQPRSNPPLHPTQFEPTQKMHLAMQTMRQANALGDLQRPGGWRHVLPFAFNMHQTPGSSSSATMEALSGVRRRQRD